MKQRQRPGRRVLALHLLIAAALLGPPARAEDTLAGLRAEVEALKAEVAWLQQQPGDAARLAELERRIDLLAAEIEKSRSGGAVEAEPARGALGLAPAASKVYRAQRGVSIGGYGEALFESFGARRQDGQPSGVRNRLDQLRLVAYLGYKFSDSILFNSELELEHATTGEGDEEKGEVSVELAYLEFRPWKRAGFRVGQLLVPLGFLNEVHEPPVFHGARRTDVETLIVPTTWRDVGGGLFGEAGPLQWRAYVVAGLSSEGFRADAGIREGRQGGSQSRADDLAVTARLDFTGVRGLLAGGSLFAGNSGQGAEAGGRRIRGRVTLFDLHAQYQRRGLQLRVLYARTRIGDAALINAANGLEGADSVGERQYGYYAQAAYDIMTLKPVGHWSVSPFLRYERLDTQDRVPAGFARDPANGRRIWTVGVGVKPIPNVVLKADYQWRSNAARTGVKQLALAVGYLF
jgi:cell division protein FtsB